MRVSHYDGRSALPRLPELIADGDAFTLVEAERTTGSFAFADLVATDAATGDVCFGRRGVPGWRIGFPDGIPADLVDRLPVRARYGRLVDRFGLWRSAAMFAVLAAIVVAFVLRTPALVARAVPASVERRLGDVMIGDFGRRGCADPAGSVALDALVRRIDPDDRQLEVHVVKLPIVNAVTLPGGRIVLFDGLINAAGSPDEVAGVIGHEIGHVRNHDVMESLLRQLGLSVLLGGMEGHVGGYTNALLAATYSRNAEARADGVAIDLLAAAQVSPLPTAAFFRRLARGGGASERIFAYVASHPVSADHAARFAAGNDPKVSYGPTLDAAKWQDLRTICAGQADDVRWRF